MTYLALAMLLIGFALVNQHYPTLLGESAALPPGYWRVTEIYDGDTIAVDMNGTIEKVRLVGVDTPETHHPKKPVECFGQAATDYTRKLIGHAPVRLEADSLSSNRDRYDRLLRYAYLPDGTLVNLKIVEDGYGFSYTTFPSELTERFETAEDAARSAGRGLWGTCPV
jgi:micrococcal nuclease